MITLINGIKIIKFNNENKNKKEETSTKQKNYLYETYNNDNNIIKIKN